MKEVILKTKPKEEIIPSECSVEKIYILKDLKSICNENYFMAHKLYNPDESYRWRFLSLNNPSSAILNMELSLASLLNNILTHRPNCEIYEFNTFNDFIKAKSSGRI